MPFGKERIFVEFQADAVPDERNAIAPQPAKIFCIAVFARQPGCQLKQLVAGCARFRRARDGILNVEHRVVRAHQFVRQAAQRKDARLINDVTI